MRKTKGLASLLDKMEVPNEVIVLDAPKVKLAKQAGKSIQTKDKPVAKKKANAAPAPKGKANVTYHLSFEAQDLVERIKYWERDSNKGATLEKVIKAYAQGKNLRPVPGTK